MQLDHGEEAGFFQHFRTWAMNLTVDSAWIDSYSRTTWVSLFLKVPVLTVQEEHRGRLFGKPTLKTHPPCPWNLPGGPSTGSQRRIRGRHGEVTRRLKWGGLTSHVYVYVFVYT